MNTTELYKSITDKILANLTISGSWKKLWQIPAPCNIEGRFYHGINPLMLSCEPYTSHVFGTFNQIRSNGGAVKQGEKGTVVVFWKRLIRADENHGDKPKIIFMLKYYYVFNSEQATWDDIGKAKIEKLNQFIFEKDNEKHQKAEDIVAAYKDCPPITFSKIEERAFYAPERDFISVPAIEYFQSKDAFYHTLFHELVHSTGHKSRLDRNMSTNKLTDLYSKEELVAEIGASYLDNIADLNWDIKNSATYIEGWSDTLRDNPMWLVNAVGKAEKATNFILGVEEPIYETEKEFVKEVCS